YPCGGGYPCGYWPYCGGGCCGGGVLGQPEHAAIVTTSAKRERCDTLEAYPRTANGPGRVYNGLRAGLAADRPDLADADRVPRRVAAVRVRRAHLRRAR